jgi:lysophospholipase L1-like esterase
MKMHARFGFLLAAALFLSGVNWLAGADQDKTEAKQEKKNPATTPAPRDANWMKRHDGFVEIAKKGEVDLLFLGDSITDMWRNKGGQPAWDKYFGSYKAANFGIGGDRTEHVLWRIQNGELDGIKPKVVVLMIGTNNTGNNSAEQIAEGVGAIVKGIHMKSKESKVLLLAVFPRNADAKAAIRAKVAAINKIIASLDDGGRSVKYMDIGEKFLQPDGALTKEIMYDALHLTTKGYEIWGEAIAPTVRQMMGKGLQAESTKDKLQR